MTMVNVDLEDLKSLVFASSAIKTIESTLAAHKRDPFVQAAMPLTEVNDRLASAMRNAERASSGTAVSWDAPLTKEEINALGYVEKAASAKKAGLGVFVISPEDKGELARVMSVYDQLAAKGMIEMGQFVQGIVWAGAPAAQLVANEKGYAARLTARGREKLAAAMVKKDAAK
jgi:hypothetical protein